MIKGICKQVVIVKSSDSDVFEEAIFIVKPQATKSGIKEFDMFTEAKRIIDEHVARYGGKTKEKRGLFKNRNI